MANDECYTPKYLVDSITRVLGTIDLDPCSCAEANSVVDADIFYDADDDGLGRDWSLMSRTVYLNPPYSNPGPWVHKAAECGVPTLVVTNNGTDTAWGQKLLRGAAAVHFPCGRINFWGPELDPKKPGNRYAQMLTLLHAPPDMVARFVAEFRDGVTFTRRY